MECQFTTFAWVSGMSSKERKKKRRARFFFYFWVELYRLKCRSRRGFVFGYILNLFLNYEEHGEKKIPTNNLKVSLKEKLIETKNFIKWKIILK